VSRLTRGIAATSLKPLSLAVHGALLGMLCVSAPAFSQAPESSAAIARKSYSIPAGSLEEALSAFAAAAGVPLSFDPALVAGKQSKGLQGSASVQEGFSRLLEGSGLELLPRRGGGYTLKAQSTAMLPEVKVTANQENAWGPVGGYVAKRSATGTKTDTPIVEIPQSISVVTSEQIQAIGAQTLKDALAYTPGVNTSPWGDESNYDWIYVRGFDAYSPGFYMDGMQLRNTGSWGIWRTENFGTERIEILRGPSSVLYGQGGPGGVVNVVSKRPTDEPIRMLQMQLGNYSHKQLAGDFSGRLDEDGKALYRVTALVQDAELATGGLPNDKFFIAPSLTLKPSTDTSITLLSQFLRLRNGSVWNNFPAMGTLLSNPNGKIPVSTFTGEPGFNRYNQDQWMLGYLLEHRVNDTWTLRQNARYGSFKTDYKTMYEGGFVTVNPGDPAAPENFRLISRTPFASKEKARSFTVDNQAQAKLQAGDWQHTLLFGLDYQRSNFDVVAHWGGTAAPIDLYDPEYGGPVTLNPPFLDGLTTLAQTGFYMQDQIKYDERWVFTLGGRYDKATIDTENRLGAGSNSSQSDGHFTGRAGMVYLAPNGLAPYVSYSESFSPITTTDPTTGKPFSPETGRQYEAGIRYQPTGRSERYSAAIFDLRRQNYVMWDVMGVPKSTGEVQVRGLELEMLIQPVRNLNLMAAYTWTPTGEVTASAVPSEVGKAANAIREHQFSLWSDYRLAGGVKIGLGARYMGSTWGTNESAPEKIPAYTLLDGMVGYEVGSWTLALNGRNLTDKDYVANCAGGGTHCSYGERRKVIATATYRW
jgi:iron complex outermembrane recepter protein